MAREGERVRGEGERAGARDRGSDFEGGETSGDDGRREGEGQRRRAGSRWRGRKDSAPFVRCVPTPNEHPIPASSAACSSSMHRATSSESEKTTTSARTSTPSSQLVARAHGRPGRADSERRGEERRGEGHEQRRTLPRVRADPLERLARDGDELERVARVLPEALPAARALRVGDKVVEEGLGRERVGEGDREGAGWVDLCGGARERSEGEGQRGLSATVAPHATAPNAPRASRLPLADSSGR